MAQASPSPRRNLPSIFGYPTAEGKKEVGGSSRTGNHYYPPPHIKFIIENFTDYFLNFTSLRCIH